MSQLLAHIKWMELHNKEVYLYGTTLEKKNNAVVFYNPRMASGKPVLEFLSRTNYQGFRRSPVLPVLVPEKKYLLVARVKTVPEKRFYIQIDFYNRQGEKFDFVILRDNVSKFICPTNTFTYTVTLYSAGCQEVHFTELQLYQDEEDTTIHLKQGLK